MSDNSNNRPVIAFPTGIGAILAIVVLVIVVALAILGQTSYLMRSETLAFLLGLLALSRLT